MTVMAWIAQKKRAMLLKITNCVSANKQVVHSNMLNEREKKIETHWILTGHDISRTINITIEKRGRSTCIL